MNEIRLTVPGGTSVITLSVGVADIIKYLREKEAVLLTDENIFFLYQEFFSDLRVIVIPSGEQEKNLERAGYIYRELVRLKADRSTWLAGLGGGVITDLAGFVSSTYMRGMGLLLVPTTLLAMVDAAVGGKNGVNLDTIKNMMGTFYQPAHVWISGAFLHTLPADILLSGAAEVIKYGMIHDPVILDLLEHKNIEEVLTADTLVENIIIRSVRSKVEIVEQDEEDRGKRRILNFGHTFGHAVERVHGLTHGEAVAIGMCVALELSARYTLLDPEVKEKLIEIVVNTGLIPMISPDPDSIIDIMQRDKKIRHGQWYYVLLEGIGKPIIQVESPDDYLSFLQDLQKNNFYERLRRRR